MAIDSTSATRRPGPQIAANSTVFGAREENRTPDLRITSQSIQIVGTGRAWYLAVFGTSESADTTSYRAIRWSLWPISGPLPRPASVQRCIRMG